MTTAIGIMMILALLAAVILKCYNEEKCSLCCLIFSLAFQILMLVWSLTPTAMDVYQGKATLKKSYANGKAIDSTVVFIKDIEKQ